MYVALPKIAEDRYRESRMRETRLSGLMRGGLNLRHHGSSAAARLSPLLYWITVVAHHQMIAPPGEISNFKFLTTPIHVVVNLLRDLIPRLDGMRQCSHFRRALKALYCESRVKLISPYREQTRGYTASIPLRNLTLSPAHTTILQSFDRETAIVWRNRRAVRKMAGNANANHGMICGAAQCSRCQSYFHKNIWQKVNGMMPVDIIRGFSTDRTCG